MAQDPKMQEFADAGKKLLANAFGAGRELFQHGRKTVEDLLDPEQRLEKALCGQFRAMLADGRLKPTEAGDVVLGRVTKILTELVKEANAPKEPAG